MPTAQSDIIGYVQPFTQAVNANPINTLYSYLNHGAGTMPLVSATDPQVCDCIGITAAPASRTDCSGWVSHVVSTVAPAHYAAVSAYTQSAFPADTCPWPRAYAWYQFALSQANQGVFQVLTDFTQVQPGDIIVWTLGDWASTTSWTGGETPKGDTGHIMVVLQGGVPLPPATEQPTVPHAKLFGVAVSDSSDLSHGRAADGSWADTRMDANAICGSSGNPDKWDHDGGLGWGVITFALDGQDRAVQFSFDVQSHGFYSPGSDKNHGGAPALLALRAL